MRMNQWSVLSLCVLSSLVSGCGAYGWDPMRTWTRTTYGSMRREAAAHRYDEATPRSVAPARVLLLEGSAGRPCEVLGLIDEHAEMGREAEALERLRADGARLGADAVTHVSFEHSGEGAPHDDEHGDDEEADLDAATDEDGAHHAEGGAALHLSGTAVRFRDLVGDRPYEILGRIEIRESMGREEEALVRLRERAHAMRADLVLGVAFVHGHGDEPIELAGTAIRFIR